MKSKFALTALATLVSASVAIPAPVAAQYHRTYRGHYSRNHHRCGGGNGAVGTVAGGVGGAVLGNVLGGGVLGTVAGGVGGALVGRSLDKSHTRSRNRC